MLSKTLQICLWCAAQQRQKRLGRGLFEPIDGLSDVAGACLAHDGRSIGKVFRPKLIARRWGGVLPLRFVPAAVPAAPVAQLQCHAGLATQGEGSVGLLILDHFQPPRDAQDLWIT